MKQPGSRDIHSAMKPFHTISVALAALLVACSGEQPVKTTAGGSLASCTTRSYEEIGGPFTLTNQDGVEVTEEDFKGRPTLIYFGFTYCPDVCPTTLFELTTLCLPARLQFAPLNHFPRMDMHWFSLGYIILCIHNGSVLKDTQSIP